MLRQFQFFVLMLLCLIFSVTHVEIFFVLLLLCLYDGCLMGAVKAKVAHFFCYSSYNFKTILYFCIKYRRCIVARALLARYCKDVRSGAKTP